MVMTGTLVIISGPSGVGKTTICRRLVECLDAMLSVSVTTRPRRDNEVDARDYHFVSVEQFESELEHGGFLEHARIYAGHYYGTRAGPVREALADGRVVILEIDINGAEQVVRRYPDAVTVFLLAPSPSDQQDRLIGRRKDSAEAVRERLSKADGEIRYAEESGVYRHFLVNDTIEGTVEQVVRIVREAKQT